ncbi:putative immunity protein [Streptomyces sp. NPDC017979]|uniref:putative immunity protein n=1 Tax=Streptomyces sp. NPDC017979 TaxID=3365024 RepID=UPI003789C074
MPTAPRTIELSEDELRQITGYAADCARRVLSIFERDRPADGRPRDAVAAADAYAAGGRRTGALRQSAWAAHRAAGLAAAAAYLHPTASAHQVRHVLGAAAHAARAAESASAENGQGGDQPLEWARRHAPPAVTAVLGRLPAAPPGGGRVGEFLRDLDAALRA